MEWVVWMWRVALSLATVGTSLGVCVSRLFIAKTEMAMRCSGVGGEEVGGKCGASKGVVCVRGQVVDGTYCR